MTIFWIVLLSLFTFSAFYVAHTWFQVGGLRGMAYFLMSIGMAIKAFTSLQLNSCTEWVDRGALILFNCATFIPVPWMVAARLFADMIFVLCLLLLIDLWRSGHNDHRAWTTRLYVWWMRVTEVDRRVKAKARRAQIGSGEY